MSNDCFIENIKIKDIRNIINFDIPLSSNERKHLIITGKNGSGKTSTIIEINKTNKQKISKIEELKKVEFFYKYVIT